VSELLMQDLFSITDYRGASPSDGKGESTS
jgi:hypothetical protein